MHELDRRLADTSDSASKRHGGNDASIVASGEGFQNIGESIGNINRRVAPMEGVAGPWERGMPPMGATGPMHPMAMREKRFPERRWQLVVRALHPRHAEEPMISFPSANICD